MVAQVTVAQVTVAQVMLASSLPKAAGAQSRNETASRANLGSQALAKLGPGV